MIFIFLIFIALLAYATYTAVSNYLKQPKETRLIKYGRFYIIEVKVLDKWIRCKTYNDLKRFYIGNIVYPFKTKADAEIKY